ncbi:hypothetical protein EI427_05320 [Flammeovirga pectinis]|uniref:PPM-type phosphatase domain-containing protein n=2 Tax=Flammeovirga pectinis TaxID=2494373 RepID=A0A3Q9FMI3_9BACT|nr:hypothetical protein EI427_05320 [Flammeovirga pectinis]
MSKHLIVFFLFLCSPLSYGQQYNISSFTIHNGLSDNSCMALIKGPHGSIWAGTQRGGISINNSQSFITIDAHLGLSDNRILDFAEGEKNEFWVATTNGINRIVNRKIKQYLVNNKTRYSVRDIEYDSINKTLYGINSKGHVFKLNQEFDKIKNINLPKNISRFTCLKSDNTGKLWVGTRSHGIFIIEKDSVIKRIVFDNDIEINVIKHFDKTKTIIGTNKGVRIINNISDVSPYQFLRNLHVQSLLVDQYKNLWIGTKSDGVYITKDGKITQHINKSNGIENNVTAIVEDDEDGIWIATDNGIFRYNNDAYTFYGKKFNIDERIIKTFQTRDFLTVLGSESALTFIENNTLKKKVKLPLKTRYLDIIEDSTNNIIIGTNNGVYKLITDKWVTISKNLNKDKVFRKPCILFNKGKNTYSFVGNSLYKIEDQQLQLIKTFDVKIGGSRITKVIYSNDKKTLWVATSGKGLVKIDQNFNVVSVFNPKHLTSPSYYITDLAVDENDNLWISTSDSGVCKLHKGADRIISFQDEKLALNIINTIGIDKNGNIWAGGNHGINHITILENDLVRIELYGKDEGFNSLLYYKSSCSVDHNQNLWFGSEKGAIKINPSHEVYSMTPPIIVYEGLEMFSDKFDWENYSNGIDLSTHLPIDLELPHDKNNISIDFVGISMNVPSKIRYKWRLIGYEDNFHPLTPNSKAFYPNLPTGDYIFQLQALNARGIASKISQDFKFTIQKRFFERRSIRALGVLIFVSLICYFFYYSIKQERIQRDILQEKVVERTREIKNARVKVEKAKETIEDTNEKLRQINERVRGSIKYAANIQNALIGCDGEFERLFPKSFNLSITKSEVTGDFTWLHENDKYIYLLLIDCTNHGVPAALISIIGNQLLDQLILDYPDIKGAELLSKLDMNLKSALNISENTVISDGMDIAVCRFEKGTRNLNFAGARRPLIIVENDELKTIKSNFCSIGIVFNDVTPSFDNFDMQLGENAICYLFSDGFSNQFNIDGEKFKKVNFKKLLFEVSSLPFAEQCSKLYSTFNNWKKGVEQGDDMMVVGFKYETNYAESTGDHKIIRKTERTERD